MSIFSNIAKQMKREAYRTGRYYCPHCNELMIFEDDSHDYLVCEHCGHSMNYEEYGFPEGEYDELLEYPSKEEVCGYDPDDD